jgi:hypothetical protein
MKILTIVLLIVLGLGVSLFGFLAVWRHKAYRHKTFFVSPGPYAGSPEVLTFQDLHEKCFEVALEAPPATYEEYLLRSPSKQTETAFSQRLFSGKDMLNTSTVVEKQGEIAAQTEKSTTDDLERLASYGFTSEEVDSLIWLQKWYQTGGSDRIELVRRWEFFHFLVINGKLDV